MTNGDAIKHLTTLRDLQFELIEAVDQKKWRDSEKAMSKSLYKQRADALVLALAALKTFS